MYTFIQELDHAYDKNLSYLKLILCKFYFVC